jgi:hypothetical protein
MRIPTWRPVLTGGVVLLLAAAGIGVVAAAGSPAPTPPNPIATAPTVDSSATASGERPARERLERRAALGAKLVRIGRHLVHVEAIVTDRDGNLITIWLDHGTVRSVADGSITIGETGGADRTVQTDAETIVRVGREDGTVADVTAGAEVFVQSRIVNGSPVAKRIVVLPAKAS